MQGRKDFCRLWYKRGFLAVLAAILVSFCLVPDQAYSLPAFPGAEGFGSASVGGRGGKVIEVTNLNDSGTGSLRACIDASGARTCVFKVGGTIALSSGLTVKNPYITIAGQTAPGGGITLKGGELTITTHDVTVRYLTIRRGPGGSNHSLGIYSNGSSSLYNIIVDHCSLSWGTDSVTESWYGPHDITWQWNIISEALDCSTHPKGCHSKGVMLGGYKFSETSTAKGGYNISLHHNLIAHNGERTPMIKASGLVDVVNNLQYNNYNKHTHVYLTSTAGTWGVNYVNNYFKKGPDTDTGKQALGLVNEGGSPASIYWNGNISYARPTDDLPQTKDVSSEALPYITTSRHAVSMPVTTTSAFVAYDQVLADAGNNKGLNADGSWYDRRDAIDKRVVNDVKNKTGHIIDDPSEVGGWLSIANGTPYKDTDKDGMPDQWETLYGFDPANAADGVSDADGDGYTNLEEFLNGTSPRGGSTSSTSTTTASSAPAAPTGLKVSAN